MLISLFIILLVLVVGAGGYFAFMVFTNFQPSSSKVNKDVDQMRAELDNLVPELMIWEGDELELLSLHQEHQSVSNSIYTTAQGVFTSIYQEPMLAYGYKKYVSPGMNAVLFAKTYKHEFVFRIRNKATFITMNGQMIGELKPDGQLFNQRGNDVLAQIEKHDGEVLDIQVMDRNMGALTRRFQDGDLYPRAFNLLPDNISEGEEVLLLSVSIYEMVDQIIKNHIPVENKPTVEEPPTEEEI